MLLCRKTSLEIPVRNFRENLKQKCRTIRDNSEDMSTRWTQGDSNKCYQEDREETVWPQFNNALICHTWTEIVGQISIGGYRGSRAGEWGTRGEEQTDRQLFINQGVKHSENKRSTRRTRQLLTKLRRTSL